jgi:hypothetical protein
VTVLPFRRPGGESTPPAEREPERCPGCGWKLPVEVRADRASVNDTITFYLTCPECSADLILIVEFT